MTKAEIKELLAGAGVFRSAVAQVCQVDEASADDYRAWISEGKHGEMAYLENMTICALIPAVCSTGRGA